MIITLNLSSEFKPTKSTLNLSSEFKPTKSTCKHFPFCSVNVKTSFSVYVREGKWTFFDYAQHLIKVSLTYSIYSLMQKKHCKTLYLRSLWFIFIIKKRSYSPFPVRINSLTGTILRHFFKTCIISIFDTE